MTTGKRSRSQDTHEPVDKSEPRLRPVADDGALEARERALDPAADADHDIAATMVARAKSGDMQAWSRLYQDHFDGLYRHLRYLTGDSQAAEELVQETFVQALCCVGRYDGRSRFSTWLHGVGLNVVRHHWRSQRSTAKAHARLTAVEEVRERSCVAGPDREVLARQRARALYAALEQLPVHLREAFILRELEGLTPAEAAEPLTPRREGSPGARRARSRPTRAGVAGSRARSDRG